MRLKKRAVAAGGRETDMARLDGRLPGQRGPWAALAAGRHGTYQTTNPPERKRLRAIEPYVPQIGQNVARLWEPCRDHVYCTAAKRVAVQ
jgi:hypothetical protein